MNKTLSISLAGFSFFIDEHAYAKLSDYLTALRNALDKNEADEVMHDIEIRMVEILKDSKEKREVINNNDIEKIISQIGKPEQIEEQEETYYFENHSKRKNKHEKRQLFRDAENRKIAGVCSGLAHYFGIGIIQMRLLWFAVFLIMIPASGSAMVIAVLYIVLWLVLPKAKTASDILKMKGKPVNFDTLKEESLKIIQFANNSSKKIEQAYQDNKQTIDNVSNNIGNILRFGFGILFALLTVGCLSAGLFFSFAIIDVTFTELGDFFFDEIWKYYLFRFFTVLCFLIPTILFAWAAFSLLSPKTKLKNMGWILGSLFLLVIGMGIYFGISMASSKIWSHNFDDINQDKEELYINSNSDTIFVDIKKVDIPENFKNYQGFMYSDKKTTVFRRTDEEIHIKRLPNITKPYLSILKEAYNYNIPIKINIPVEISQNKILIPNYVSFPYQERARRYKVRYELFVPEHIKVISSNENISIIDDEDNDNWQNSMDDEMKNFQQKMEKEVSININGTKIEYDSDEPSFIKINGKRYSTEQAEKYFEKRRLNIKISDLINAPESDNRNTIIDSIEVK